MARSFDELVAEAEAVDVSGWDFSWLDGRATEERPPWGYSRLLSDHLRLARASLDIQTGGGEVLDHAEMFPPVAVATESFPPNVAAATTRLHPRGVVVVADPDDPPLPFADAAFDLVTSRHPTTVWWDEIARVLRPGGTYLAQHVGPRSAFEIIEFFRGPRPSTDVARRPDDEVAAARDAGLEILDLRTARLRIEVFDVGAMVYLLRKVVWWVPGFTVDAHVDRLRQMHALIEREGRFVAHSTRHLIKACKPAG